MAGNRKNKDDKELENRLKREALQLAAMLPRDKEEARKVLNMAAELLDEFL